MPVSGVMTKRRKGEVRAGAGVGRERGGGAAAGAGVAGAAGVGTDEAETYGEQIIV